MGRLKAADGLERTDELEATEGTGVATCADRGIATTGTARDAGADRGVSTTCKVAMTGTDGTGTERTKTKGTGTDLRGASICTDRGFDDATTGKVGATATEDHIDDGVLGVA